VQKTEDLLETTGEKEKVRQKDQEGESRTAAVLAGGGRSLSESVSIVREGGILGKGGKKEKDQERKKKKKRSKRLKGRAKGKK